MTDCSLKRASPPTIAASSANARSPCSSSKPVNMPLHVIERVRPLRMARDLRDLPRRQLGVDFLGQLLAFFLQARDLLGDVERGIVLHEAQLVDLRFELGDRLLEFEKSGLHTMMKMGRAANDTEIALPSSVRRLRVCAAGSEQMEGHGAKNATVQKTTPITPSPTPIHASTMVLVTMAADASTMAICSAADAVS